MATSPSWPLASVVDMIAMRFQQVEGFLVCPGAVIERPDTIAQRELDRHIGETEVGVDLHRLQMECRDFLLDLLGHAEDVAVVLGECTHAHDAVQRAGRLVAMAATEFAVTNR